MFDKTLKDKHEIRKIVADQWLSEPNDSVFTRVGKIRYNIIQWVREQNLNNNMAIKKAQAELEAALSSIYPDPAIITSLTETLENAYKEDELYWPQRSRI